MHCIECSQPVDNMPSSLCCSQDKVVHQELTKVRGQLPFCKSYLHNFRRSGGTILSYRAVAQPGSCRPLCSKGMEQGCLGTSLILFELQNISSCPILVDNQDFHSIALHSNSQFDPCQN